MVVFLWTWSYGDGGGVHRRGWPPLFWDTRLQGRQPQQQLGHCRNSVDIADLWGVVGDFNSFLLRGFLPSSSLKSHRYSLLVAFGPFFVVGGSVEICGLVLKGMETETNLALEDLCYTLNKISSEFYMTWEFGTKNPLYPSGSCPFLVTKLDSKYSDVI